MNIFQKESLKFKPENIKVLIVGESPPVQEKNFFFFAPNSDLYNFTKIAYYKAYSEKLSENLEFLNAFMESGCFLDDLCELPINNIKDKNLRIKEWDKSVNSLKNRIIDYNPIAIICIMKQIENYVSKAILLSGIKIQYFYTIGYPAFKKIAIINYIEELSKILIFLKDKL